MYSRDIVDETLRLKALGLTDHAIATQCGVSIRAIRHWRYGTRRTLRADRTMYCPKCAQTNIEGEAYAYLLGLYLGDGHITRSRRDVYILWIPCDDKHPGLMDLCAETVESVFPVKTFRVNRGNGCTSVKAASKHWPCLFPQHGVGHKHSRSMALEPWQQVLVREHPEPFIRGLIHSDGCRVLNRIRKKGTKSHEFYEYPRYHFTNTSTDIVGLLTAALDQLGIEWKGHTKTQPPYRDQIVVSVSKRAAVARMDEFVGPKY
jgi:hypothetical protein